MLTRILHLTDLHLHADPDFLLMGVNPRQTLLDVLDHVKSSQRVPDLILITGDLTHDETSAGYQYLRSILDPLQIPVYVLPGNHDIPQLMEQTLNSTWIKTRQQILLDTWQIIMLDSTIENNDGGALKESQLLLLQQCLEDKPELYALICVHHQPVPVGSTWMDTMQIENGAQFLQMIQAYPQVKAVLWGHVHQEFSRQLTHIQLLSSPATCIQFLPGAESIAIDEERGPGYRWLMLSDTGEIETAVIWV